MTSSLQASTQSSLVCLVDSLLMEVGKDAKTSFTFQYFDIPLNLSAQVLDQTFLIVEEAAKNIVRHAHANHAFIQLYCREGELIVSIEDDGIGFRYANKRGNGLCLMENRVAGLRGSIEFSSDNNSGTSIMIVIPLTELDKK